MANGNRNTLCIALLAFLLLLRAPNPASAKIARLLSLVPQTPVILKYHNGELLKGHVTVNIIWYGEFSRNQKSIILDFFHSLNAANTKQKPSVAKWWSTIGSYKGGPSYVNVGKQITYDNYPLGKILNMSHIEDLASRIVVAAKNQKVINFVLTSSRVGVQGFCLNKCGQHGDVKVKNNRIAYAWVGNAINQCAGQCAWPFHKPIQGPQVPPLVAPNLDVGVDGMIINVATVLAGTVTNPFDKGYYQGSGDAPLEAVSACTGIFGKGAFPGYPGVVLKHNKTGASYNAVGASGRKYLLPAMWDPKTSACKTLV